MQTDAAILDEIQPDSTAEEIAYAEHVGRNTPHTRFWESDAAIDVQDWANPTPNYTSDRAPTAARNIFWPIITSTLIEAQPRKPGVPFADLTQAAPNPAIQNTLGYSAGQPGLYDSKTDPIYDLLGHMSPTAFLPITQDSFAAADKISGFGSPQPAPYATSGPGWAAHPYQSFDAMDNYASNWSHSPLYWGNMDPEGGWTGTDAYLGSGRRQPQYRQAARKLNDQQLVQYHKSMIMNG